MNGAVLKRGAFFVFEGCDRSGKSTQGRLLVDKLWELGFTAQLMTYPDRSTATGRIINNYLGHKEELSDEAVHLLFSANRWENSPKMWQLLNEGVTLVVDRYSFSGVAYSSAKEKMDFDWCRNPETGLPKPDVVFFLNLPPRAAEERSGYGDERYEKSSFQDAVMTNYMKLRDETWQMIDASREAEIIHEEILKKALETMKKCEDSEMKRLWC